MIKKRILIGPVLSLLFFLPVIAGTMGDVNTAALSPFSLGAFGGYGVIDGSYGQDGNFSQARLAGGYDFYTFKNVLIGVELGVQSGNTMRLEASADIINTTGGLPIQVVSKPFVDLLVSTSTSFSANSSLSLILKGGIAYRQLQLQDRSSGSDTLNKVNGEFQAGLGYAITNHARVNAIYQAIYNTNNAGIGINSVEDVTLSQIPTQQAGFLGFVYTF